MPPDSRSASKSELTALFATVQQHFQDVIVPLWQGPGWNAELALPYEALDAEHHPLPPQRYRAMACARQLYLFSSLIGQVPGAKERAAALFRSLQQHFHDAEHGGWFYSIDPQGAPGVGLRGHRCPILKTARGPVGIPTKDRVRQGRKIVKNRSAPRNRSGAGS